MPKILPGRNAILRFKIAPKSKRIMNTTPFLIKQAVSHAAWKSMVRRYLLAGAKPVQAEVQAAARSLPSRGTSSPIYGARNLRERIANSIEIETRTGTEDAAVSIVSRKSKMGDAPSLPARTNEGRWRHPVMGNDNVWVTQTSRQGWFDKTALKAGEDHVKDELLDLLAFLKVKWTIK